MKLNLPFYAFGETSVYLEAKISLKLLDVTQLKIFLLIRNAAAVWKPAFLQALLDDPCYFYNAFWSCIVSLLFPIFKSRTSVVCFNILTLIEISKFYFQGLVLVAPMKTKDNKRWKCFKTCGYLWDRRIWGW